MGMYTELVLSCKVVNKPAAVDVLKVMCTGGEAEPFPVLPEHPLFESGRWAWMFRSNSYYHVPRSHASIEYDDIGKYWTLIVRCDFKNYGDEVDHFIDWITPYISRPNHPKQMIGYHRYEEDDEPVIIYVEGTEESEDDE